MQLGSSSRSGNPIPRVPRRKDGSDFPSVVLALPVSSSRPAKELPPKKRIYVRLNAILEMKQAKDAEKEDSGEILGSNNNKSGQCLLNRDSSIPCPNIDGQKVQDTAEDLPSEASLVKQDNPAKRKRGRPKKKKSKSPLGGNSGNF